jgi:hypothetical protein
MWNDNYYFYNEFDCKNFTKMFFIYIKYAKS